MEYAISVLEQKLLQLDNALKKFKNIGYSSTYKKTQLNAMELKEAISLLEKAGNKN